MHAHDQSTAAGTAFAISYQSDLSKVTMENLVVFSVLEQYLIVTLASCEQWLTRTAPPGSVWPPTRSPRTCLLALPAAATARGSGSPMAVSCEHNLDASRY